MIFFNQSKSLPAQLTDQVRYQIDKDLVILLGYTNVIDGRLICFVNSGVYAFGLCAEELNMHELTILAILAIVALAAIGNKQGSVLVQLCRLIANYLEKL